MGLIAGKVMMDRFAPDNLMDTAGSSYDDSRALLERWHGFNRQRYAITPRFAATSAPDQLALAGQLAREHPDALVQTHWAENRAEIAWIADLFPERASYLDVYDYYGLLGDHTVLAHGIHINDQDRRTLTDTGTRIAFCPTSNTFLGSGLFDFRSAREAGVTVGLASDVGGGTSLSMLASMAEAYKVCRLQDQPMTPFQAFYLSTLGNARVLHQGDRQFPARHLGGLCGAGPPGHSDAGHEARTKDQSRRNPVQPDDSGRRPCCRPHLHCGPVSVPARRRCLTHCP